MYICTMAGTTRQNKFNRLIQKELSEIFQRNKKGILDNTLISIADVRISTDLSVAKIYISMMLVKDKQGTLDRINAAKKEIRKELGNRIGKQVRIIPDLIFYIDEVEENALRMDELIKGLNIPPNPQPDKE